MSEITGQTLIQNPNNKEDNLSIQILDHNQDVSRTSKHKRGHQFKRQQVD